MSRLSNLVTAVHARLLCSRACGTQSLSEQQYHEQIMDVAAGWKCPKCNAPATFDDHHWADEHYRARAPDLEGDEK